MKLPQFNWNHFFIFYIIMAILSFGYCAANTYVNDSRFNSYERCTTGFAAGVFWPLYVSWTLFEYKPKNIEK